LRSIYLLQRASVAFAEKCILGISANYKICASYLEQGLALATAFVPHFGYDKATELAKRAYESRKTIREVALEGQVLPEQQTHRILDEVLGGKSRHGPEV
jgi:aspartate ammonia-lyase